jgi:hypothetical protein
MTGVQEVFNKKHHVTQVLVHFSGPVDAGRADATVAYRLTIAGKHGSFTARSVRAIALASAAYSGATDSVGLAPKKPFNLGKPVQLRVSGEPPSGLTDALGRLIDGDRDGRPGGDAVAILSKMGASVAALRRPGTPTSPVVRAVDYLLAVGRRGGVTHTLIGLDQGVGVTKPTAPGPVWEDMAVGPTRGPDGPMGHRVSGRLTPRPAAKGAGSRRRPIQAPADGTVRRFRHSTHPA